MSQGMIYAIVVLSVSFNAAAQLLLRIAMVDSNTASPQPQSLLSWVLALVSSPPLLGGLVLFGFSILAWLVVLSRLPVSIAYPMASLGYVVAALLGVIFLREPVHFLQIVGIVVICLGVGLIARSAVP